MKLSFRDAPKLQLHGYSPDSAAHVFEQVLGGVRPSMLRGDFVLVAEGIEAATGLPLTVFVSTVVAAVPYYFVKSGGHFAHASNVFDCCKAADLTWHWNWDSLAQLVLFEHVLGDASLHAGITRVPQASIVWLRGEMQFVDQDPFWRELGEAGAETADPRHAADLILELIGELPAQQSCSLSLSAGYDSRLLLACLMHLGKPVTTACMGAADATDPRIASALAQSAGCGFRRVEIEAADYLAQAENIVRTTSGEKIFWHWHTGIYSRKAGFSTDATHLAGCNGEFARSYFFDKGFVAELADFSGYSRWDRWLALKNSRLRRVGPGIRAALDPFGNFHRALDADTQLTKVFHAGTRFGDGLDRFYASTRVRNLIGLGLALYRSHFPTMSPFLDARFIRYAARLRRHDKLANRMHRTVISALRPELLAFPTDDSGVPMGSLPDSLYFLKARPSKSYQRHVDAQRLPEVAGWARTGFRVLSERDDDPPASLDAEVTRWNHAITVGAVVRQLDREKIRMQ